MVDVRCYSCYEQARGTPAMSVFMVFIVFHSFHATSSLAVLYIVA
jgi:hypothetical protein